MKLKFLVAALAVGFAAQAGAAAIDTGAGGNGGVFFNVWDATGSYTLNLGIDLNSFETQVAASNVNLSYATDATLTSFLSGRSSYNWNIMASDSQGAVRVLETAASGATLTNKASNIVKTAAGQATILVSNINLGLASTNSATFTTADAGYIGKASGGVATINGYIGWPAAALGTQAANSFATGLKLFEAKGNATGTTALASLNLNANARAYFDGSTLHVAAVPEPETYAMFLAGLGLMGAIARRRMNRA